LAAATTVLHHIGRNGKADADRAARFGVDRRVDTDERALHVDQRAARIARIDRRVGLDEEAVVGDADMRARQRRDDPLRHRLADAERIADRQHEIADFERIGIAELQRRERGAAVLDLQHGEVAVRRAARRSARKSDRRTADCAAARRCARRRH
jgi:hypothetical protein